MLFSVSPVRFNSHSVTFVSFNLCLYLCVLIIDCSGCAFLWSRLYRKRRQFPDHCVRNSFGVTPYCFLNCRLK